MNWAALHAGEKGNSIADAELKRDRQQESLIRQREKFDNEALVRLKLNDY
ncbi:hypothetical protein PPACK8108_LOCUS6719 [Phakopsora pachyrhizi]|uniref:Uncharacterized protein n=1 Tax=Phakopsora pachyrhizi TaxID=170000 RepID=A0AAV0ARW9_PHAPC|nr:hypothetical protein PPACK8108_LOCUS6719 [Phakopsora pachyrhizi]